MTEKLWRECGDYIKSLPESRLTGVIGVMVLSEGVRYYPYPVGNPPINPDPRLKQMLQWGV